MRRTILALILTPWFTLSAGAGDQPVVVELFTSQGCSSCPPADHILTEMALRDDVLPLSLHVDYWNYIGWVDIFSDPRFTVRQKAYARASGEPMIYTPQAIVDGRSHMIGSQGFEIEAAIAAEKARPDSVQLAVARNGRNVRLEARMVEGAEPRPMVVQIVPFRPTARVEIRAGENAGSVIEYANVVTDWRILGEWDGHANWTGSVELDGPAALLVQDARSGPGEILGAVRID